MTWGMRGVSVLAVLFVVAAAAGLLKVPPIALAVLVLGGIAAVLAMRHPLAALVIATALVILVPFYDGRYITGAIGLTPMSAACLVLLPAAFAQRRTVRWGIIDVAFLALVLLRIASYFVNFSSGFGASITYVLQVAMPYLVYRLLTTDIRSVLALSGTVVATGALLASEAIAERSGVPNPFFTLIPPQYQAAQWARPELRGGVVRAEASFGHPIAFGMFLVLVLIVTLALVLTVRSTLLRIGLLFVLGLTLLALTATLSRGPLVVAVVGMLGWMLVCLHRVSVLRIAQVAGVALAVVIATPVLGTVNHLIASSTGDTREAASARYRLEVFAVAKDPQQMSLLGRPNQSGTVSEAVRERTGLKSIDSEYALQFLFAGVLGLVAIVALAVLVIGVAFRPGLSPLERAWAMALAASFINLITVALLTQQAELFWASTAVVAGIGQRSRRRPRRPRAAILPAVRLPA